MKEKLQACRMGEMRIKQLIERLERIESVTERTTQTWGNIGQRGGDNDKILLCVAEIEEIKTELLIEIVEEEKKRKECKKWLQTLPDNQRMILELHYFDGLKWAEVAKKVNYSQDYCFELQKKAFLEIPQ